jgi:CO/xanthine dehydrogenase FAD-binding subunit
MRIQTAVVIFGGIDTAPYEDLGVERLLTGKKLSPALVKNAARVALADNSPLSQNSFKVEIARGLLSSSLARIINLIEKKRAVFSRK